MGLAAIFTVAALMGTVVLGTLANIFWGVGNPREENPRTQSSVETSTLYAYTPTYHI